jgi:hypothetical protein
MNLSLEQRRQLTDCAAILEANSARLRLLLQGHESGSLIESQVQMASNDLYRVADRLDELSQEVAFS